MYGCQMAMEMMDLDKEDLVPQVKDVITAMDFFEKSEGAQTIFI
jgi:peroxiredoxin family protein